MNEDHLSNEISVEAKIEGKGVTAKIKSRFLSATDRLLGCATDIPATYFEYVSKKIRTKGDVEIKMIEAEGKAAIEKLADDPDFGVIIAGEYTKSEIRKIENKKKIVESSLDYIIADLDEVNAEEQAEYLDDDWLNYFESYAEKASSERMQDLWARVLSGEARTPYTYSLTTLRFLSELDRNIAELFERYMKLCFQSGSIVTPKKLEGKNLADLTFLQESGLLNFVGGSYQHTHKSNDGIIYLKEQNSLLILQVSGEIKIPLIPLTRTGREIVSILPLGDAKGTLRTVFEAVESNVNSATLNLIVKEHSTGGHTYSLLETWKEESPTV